MCTLVGWVGKHQISGLYEETALLACFVGDYITVNSEGG